MRYQEECKVSFFRKYTIAAAEKFGVSGFVKNNLNGSVYIEAEGSKEAITKFIKWCHKGSPVSKVERIEVGELTLANFAGFKIRYE